MLMHPSYNLTLMYAMVWTINSHYARDSTKPLTIIQFATRRASRGMHNDLIDAALGLASGAGRIKFMLQSEHIDDTDTTEAMMAADSSVTGRTTGIWILDSMRAYYRLERLLLHPGSWFKRNGDYCIIYTGQEPERMVSIQEMFRNLFAIYVINVNVFLTHRQTGIVDIYNYYPYQSHRCQSYEPVLYGTFVDGLGASPHIHLENRVLFFDSKLENMHGCKLVAVTFQHRPYVFIEDDPSTFGGRRIYGIEGMLFRLLAERMNFTIDLIEEKNRDRGVVLPNGTLTGALKMIVEGTANVTFCSFLYSQERSLMMVPSTAYTSFPIVLCIPGGRQLSPLERLTKPLGYITWLCIVFSVLLGFGIIGALQVFGTSHLRRFVLGEMNRVPCWQLWSTMLGNWHSLPPSRNFARYLLAMWMLEMLVLRAAYTGELFILLQDVRVRTPMRTLNEVLNTNYMIHMMPAMLSVFKTLLPSSRTITLSNFDESLKTLRDDDDANIVVPVLQPTVARFNMESWPEKPGLTVLQEPLLVAPLTLYMRPHSYFKQRINKLLINMMSSGMVHRYRRMYLDRIDHMSAPKSREPTKLSLSLLAGLFICYIIMQTLAFFVFLLELRSASPHRLRLRRLMNAANRYIA